MEKNNSENLKQQILELLNWGNYFLSYWKLIVLTGFLGGLIGITLAFFNKPVYIGKLSFVLEENKSSGGLGGAAALASQFGFDLAGGGGGAFAGENIVDVLQSRSMLENALLREFNWNGKNQTFMEYYLDVFKVRAAWDEDKTPGITKVKFPIGINKDSFSVLQDSVMGVCVGTILKRNLEVIPNANKKKSTMLILCKSPDPIFSKYLPVFLIDAASKFYIYTKTARTQMNVNILQYKTDSVKNELSKALYGRAYFADNNLNTIRQSAQLPRVKKELDVQALTTMYTELVKNLELNKVLLLKETPLVQVIDIPKFPLPKERVGKLQAGIVGGLVAGLIVGAYLFFRRKWLQIISGE